MKKVTCDWIPATEENRRRFPDFVELHEKHGDDMSECDAWKCECGNDTCGQGFYPCTPSGAECEPDHKWQHLYKCDMCNTIYDQATGEEKEATEGQYKWDSPYDWLMDKATDWDEIRLLAELRNVALLVDSDTLQDLYQTDMDNDGYFKKQ